MTRNGEEGKNEEEIPRLELESSAYVWPSFEKDGFEVLEKEHSLILWKTLKRTNSQL